MKSVNSDLEFLTPMNDHPMTYESIIFHAPPYPKPVEKNINLARINSEDCLTIWIKIESKFKWRVHMENYENCIEFAVGLSYE